MTIQMNSTNNVAFQGNLTKRTPRGNEYPITHTSRNVGCAVGLLSGALGAKLASRNLCTKATKGKITQGKRDIITALNNMNKDLSCLGPKGKHAKVISTGVKIVATGLSVIGLFVGASIGKAIDSHNNHQSAKAADKVAKANA